VEVTVPKDWRALALLRPQMAACRVASIDGRETGWVRMNLPGSTLPANGHRLRLLFSATVQDLGYQPDCPGLITRPPGRDEVLGVRLDFTLTRGTREWRLHRQCDQGPLTLMVSSLIKPLSEPRTEYGSPQPDHARRFDCRCQAGSRAASTLRPSVMRML
jgi:hypothetical protein